MNDKTTHYRHFIEWIEERLGPDPRKKDSGGLARLKRGESPKSAPDAWEILIRLGIRDEHFLPCLTVGAAMCRYGKPKDGTASLGKALASCYEPETKEQGSLRLRRLLACTSMKECCAVLRPLLAFIASKGKADPSFARLLDELVAFDWPERQEKIKLKWATEYWAEEREKS